MPDDFRHFEATDPFGRNWKADFLWQQNGISIRHADTVDVKFELVSDERHEVRVIALPLPALLELTRKTGRPISDAWCSRLAARHLKHMIENGEDMDLPIVTPALETLEKHHAGAGAAGPTGR